MGNCTSSRSTETSIIGLSRRMFIFHSPIGKGSFGKVWKVTFKRNGKTYAMKVMLKARIVLRKSVCSIQTERKLLGFLNHPFLIKMQYAFQDQRHLYLLSKYMPGGDLRYLINEDWVFTEEYTKFLIACILASLGYLHSQGIIHKDVKPENLIFDGKGYLNLTDFGAARMLTPENSKENSGTPDYMAPEVLCCQNHTYAADLYSVGVIMYELILGARPYSGNNRNEIKKNVMDKQVQIEKKLVSQHWSSIAIDLCNRLIERKPDHRIGKSGISEVIHHEWFEGFDWNQLLEKQIQAPCKPKGPENLDSVHVDKKWRDKNLINTIKREKYERLFPGYFFDRDNIN